MNYSFEYIDIILLAMIAGFIFLRLRGILGKRTGFEGKAPGQFQGVLKKVEKMNIDLISYEPNKDKTDFELSLDSINEPEEKNIFIIGGEEGEIDHLFSIFSLVINYEFATNVTWLYMDKTIVFKNNMSIFLNEGTKFSVVPITNLNKLTISGAKWNLNEENIEAGSSKTLRNESVENQIMISCNEGLFSVIY